MLGTRAAGSSARAHASHGHWAVPSDRLIGPGAKNRGTSRRATAYSYVIFISLCLPTPDSRSRAQRRVSLSRLSHKLFAVSQQLSLANFSSRPFTLSPAPDRARAESQFACWIVNCPQSVACRDNSENVVCHTHIFLLAHMPKAYCLTRILCRATALKISLTGSRRP